MAIDNFNILLCKNYDVAKELNPEVTVEAEWGKYALEGSIYGLNHHGDFSYNPAPCNWKLSPIEEGTIVCSHIDLDTIGGILAVMGEKPKDERFWKAAEYIDVNGPQHIYELPQKVQNQLNAIDAWENWKAKKREEEGYTPSQENVVNIKDVVLDWKEALDVVCNEKHPRHEEFLQYGQDQEAKMREQVNCKLLLDDGNIRAFITDGVFCAGSYYSETFGMSEKATITYNTKHHSISLAFFDGGEQWSAKEIMQDLFGPEAGGHDGIAGSPRDWDMTLSDFVSVLKVMEEKVRESGEYNQLASDIAINSLAFGLSFLIENDTFELILRQIGYENNNYETIEHFEEFLDELSDATKYDIQLIRDEESSKPNDIIGISYCDNFDEKFNSEFIQREKERFDMLIDEIEGITHSEEEIEL